MSKVSSQNVSGYDAYLFVHFVNPAENTADSEQVYFSVSKDGKNWFTLNNERPVLTSKLGEKGARDPFIVCSPNRDKFYIIATDLSIYHHGDWSRAQKAGSQSIIVWESEDLVNWSDQRLVKIAPETAGCTWAPEAFYSEEKDEFLVYWASRTNFGADKQRIFCARTKDFKTFSEPEVYIEEENDVIDTNIIEHNGSYFRFSKNEEVANITLEVSDSLFGEFTVMNTNLVNIYGMEGPACFKLKGEDKWCLLLDAYQKEGKYVPYYTTDLHSGQFTRGEDLNISVRAKHGGVIPITVDEYDALMKFYGTGLI
jgi:hypothetical protein